MRKTCEYCGKQFNSTGKGKRKFCSMKCRRRNDYFNRGGKEYFKKWKAAKIAKERGTIQTEIPVVKEIPTKKPTGKEVLYNEIQELEKQKFQLEKQVNSLVNVLRGIKEVTHESLVKEMVSQVLCDYVPLKERLLDIAPSSGGTFEVSTSSTWAPF
jgi:hypothetical protein